MYKKISCILLVLTLFLTACTKPIEEEPKIYVHHLETSNFESFYDVSHSLTFKDDGAYEIRLDVKPKTDFLIDALVVNFKIMATEVFQAPYLETFEIDATSIEHLEEIFKVAASVDRKDAFISKLEITVLSGVIQTTEIINITTKTYPIILNDSFNPFVANGYKEQNEAVYHAFMDFVLSLDNQAANQLTARMTQTTQVKQNQDTVEEVVYTTTNIQKEPFYMAITDSNENGVFIHPLDDTNDFVMFTTSPNKKAMDKLLIEPSAISNADLLSFVESTGQPIDSDLTQAYFYNPNKMLFMEVDNGFMVSAYVKEFMPKDAYDQLILMYQNLGLNTGILENAVVNMEITSMNDAYTMTIDMTFEFEYPVVMSVRSIVSISVDYLPFKTQTAYDETFLLLPATQLEDVVIKTDPLKTVYVSRPQTYPLVAGQDYFKVYLEAGVYKKYYSNSNAYVQLLNMAGENVNETMTKSIDDNSHLDYTIIISQSGYYYIRVTKDRMTTEYNFMYEKIGNIPEPEDAHTLVFGQNDIQINAPYDIAYYIFEAKEDMIIEITGDDSPLFYFPEKTSAKNYYNNFELFGRDGDKTWIYAKAGKNHLFFNMAYADTVSIQVTPYDIHYYDSIDIDSMHVISNTYLENPILLGIGDNLTYLRLDAKYAAYTFSYTASHGFLFQNISIYDAITNVFIIGLTLERGQETTVFLDESTYYIRVTGGSYPYEVNLKVDETLIENNTVIETLNFVEDMDVDIELIPYVSGTLIYDKHEIRHKFTIENPQTIIVGIDDIGHRLYDANGHLMTFDHINYETTRTLYFLLPGTYEIAPFAKDTSRIFVDYKLHIAMLEQLVEQDTYHLKEPALFEKDMENLLLTTNHPYDYEVIQVTIEERGLYYVLANKVVYIYDEALKQVIRISANTATNVGFGPGTYYITSSFDTLDDLELTFYRIVR